VRNIDMKKTLMTFTGILVILLNNLVFETAHSASTPKPVTTTTAIKNAKWNSTIKISYSKNSIVLQADGLPNHAREAYYAVPKSQGVVIPDATTATVVKDPTKAQTYKVTIPAIPKYTTKTTNTSLGLIGVMISGAALYNPFEGDGTTVAMANNFTITDANGITASFVDKCAGHPIPNSGAYHYHGLPNCVTTKVDKAKGASHIIGFALDGFPIYGGRDIKGKTINVNLLDKCNGIFSPTPEFPKGIYHYVLPGTADARSSIVCFHGVVDSSQMSAMPNMGPVGGGAKPDLASAAAKLGITQDQLAAALGNKMPPDLAAAAKTLGISEAALREALGVKG
jgi:hypothetical protein